MPSLWRAGFVVGAAVVGGAALSPTLTVADQRVPHKVDVGEFVRADDVPPPTTTTTVPATTTTTSTTTTTIATSGVSPATMAEWEKVAICEEGGNWHVRGAVYSGGLGISNTNWIAFGGGQYAYSAADATPEEQVIIAQKIQYNPPDQYGCTGSW